MIRTRASAIKIDSKVELESKSFNVVKFEGNKNKSTANKKKNPVEKNQREDEKNKKKVIPYEKVRKDVINFGSAGKELSDRMSQNRQLLIKLGAKVKQGKNKNKRDKKRKMK
jgi:hypothetical protein